METVGADRDGDGMPSSRHRTHEPAASVDPVRTRHLPLSAATRVGAAAILALTALFAAVGADMVRDGLRGQTSLDTVAAGMMWGFGAHEVAAGSVLAGSVVLVLCGLTAACAIGMLARRGWAREGAILMMAAYAMVLLPGSVAGLWHLDQAPNAPWGVLIACIEIVILVGLLSRQASDDFAHDG